MAFLLITSFTLIMAILEAAGELKYVLNNNFGTLIYSNRIILLKPPHPFWIIPQPNRTKTTLTISELESSRFENCKSCVVMSNNERELYEICQGQTPNVTTLEENVIFVNLTSNCSYVELQLQYYKRNVTDCDFSEIRCNDGNGCYNTSNICDGYFDCVDHSDEVNCGKCGNNGARCNSKEDFCFDVTRQRCDGVAQCPNAEDEMFCKDCPQNSNCSQNECTDCNQMIYCGPSDIFFLCDNMNCVSKGLVHNGIDDCGDGSDEEPTKQMNYLMVTALASTCLSVTFLVSFCFWYLRHKTVNQLPEIDFPIFHPFGLGHRSRFSDSDFTSRGELFEAFVQARRNATRRKRSSRRPQPEIFKESSNCSLLALASLGINPEDCIDLTKNKCEHIDHSFVKTSWFFDESDDLESGSSKGNCFSARNSGDLPENSYMVNFNGLQVRIQDLARLDTLTLEELLKYD